jgi:hypothetical protein
MSNHNKKKSRKYRPESVKPAAAPAYSVEREPRVLPADVARDPLLQLRELVDVRRAARVTERELVQVARSAGVSWSEIGGALGMSAQGAIKRNRVVES